MKAGKKQIRVGFNAGDCHPERSEGPWTRLVLHLRILRSSAAQPPEGGKLVPCGEQSPEKP
jgi:hypothetical protein